MAPTPTRDWLNIVAKWRTVLAGWQLGTRAKGDSEGDAVRDSRELLLMLRVDVSALAGLLIEKGVFTQEEWTHQVYEEARLLNAALETRFPGFSASEEGIHMKMPEAATTMSRLRWKP